MKATSSFDGVAFLFPKPGKAAYRIHSTSDESNKLFTQQQGSAAWRGKGGKICRRRSKKVRHNQRKEARGTLHLYVQPRHLTRTKADSVIHI